MLIVLGAIRMQAFLSLEKYSLTIKVLLVAGVVQLSHSLAAHSWFWRIPSQGNVTRESYAIEFGASVQPDLLY